MDLETAKTRLRHFYQENADCFEDDEVATTYLSFCTVLLAAVLIETWSADLIATLTKLPISFVAAVLRSFEANDGFFSVNYANLMIAVHSGCDEDLDAAVFALSEGLWEEAEIQCSAILNMLRAGKLYDETAEWRTSKQKVLSAPAGSRPTN